MTAYELVISDLGLSPDTEFKDKIERTIDYTQAVILHFLRRDELPAELDEVLIAAAEEYFVTNFKVDMDGDGTVETNTQEISSINDNGQSVSYRSAKDNISAEAKAAGLDGVLGKYYGVLTLYRRAWI